MTREEAKEVFLNRGFIDGIYNGDKWREACIVISKWLEQESFINKPCISSEVCEHDKQKVLDKIRVEILKEMLSHSGTGEEVIQAYADGLKKGLNILDKYKAETENTWHHTTH